MRIVYGMWQRNGRKQQGKRSQRLRLKCGGRSTRNEEASRIVYGILIEDLLLASIID
jgi:hypothetical protein